MGIKVTKPTICYAHTADNPCYIPPPEEYLKHSVGGRTKTSTIEVTYNPGFTPEAIAVFEYAVGIWESLITSSVPIKIDAYWSSLGSGVLGGALYTSAYANFTGAQKLNVFYPVAMAEKITGQNLNGNNPDIFVQFSSSANWHYNTGTPPPSGQFDLATVVLHEIGHGLGFAGTFTVNGSSGEVGLQSSGIPIIYDVPIENAIGSNLIQTVSSPSPDLRAQLIGDNLFFNSATTLKPKIYAPFEFNGGSSISHLDETTFNNTASALMTPRIAPQERLHDPGIAWDMLKDMGWEIVKIIHQPLPDSEDTAGPFVITTTLQADNGYNSSSLKLNYTVDGSAFTVLDMISTGVPNQFTASIPGSGNPEEYGYFIAVNDEAGREFANPGKIVRKLASELQNLHVFSTGPDTEAPVITHAPKPFLLESETALEIEARITDNIGIASVTLEYQINGGGQTNQSFILQNPGADSIYRSSINLGAGLSNGDVVTYRIVAIDNSSNSNQAASPSTGFFTLNVVGLEPTQDSYANDFNTPSNDFFGNGFSIAQPAGFNDPAIHSDHPYTEGNGFPNDELNLIYQLKIPVRVKAQEATIVFDEIVLVEPGEPGTVFGDEQFWDYVIVEGSKDGGLTWTPVADGYDSRANPTWLTRYNSAINSNNISTAVGDPALFRTQTLDLLNQFETGDEVVIRFRLFSDPFAAGWGWAIDNLKIQIDDSPPLILHDHIDFALEQTDPLETIINVSDPSGISSIIIEARVNGGTVTENDLSIISSNNSFPISIPINQLMVGDVFEYRIIATDSVGNSSIFPPSGNFLKIPVVNFGGAIDAYSNTFNSPTTDFIGNFFSVTQPDNFSNGAIHSEHFYPNGLGLNKTSSFQYLLTKPITISSSNPLIRFDEIVIVEGHNTGAVFGDSNFKDYVIVEGSKDGGNTWNRFLDGYDIVGGLPSWVLAFNSGIDGNPNMYRTRILDMTANGNFQPGDQVIIRFRLFSNETITGWGWAIDNLFIQDPITSLESSLSGLQLYPNPVTQNSLTLKADALSFTTVKLELISIQGQTLYGETIDTSAGKMHHQVDMSPWPAGIYIIKIQGNQGEKILHKIIKTN